MSGNQQHKKKKGKKRVRDNLDINLSDEGVARFDDSLPSRSSSLHSSSSRQQSTTAKAKAVKPHPPPPASSRPPRDPNLPLPPASRPPHYPKAMAVKPPPDPPAKQSSKADKAMADSDDSNTIDPIQRPYHHSRPKTGRGSLDKLSRVYNAEVITLDTIKMFNGIHKGDLTLAGDTLIEIIDRSKDIVISNRAGSTGQIGSLQTDSLYNKSLDNAAAKFVEDGDDTHTKLYVAAYEIVKHVRANGGRVVFSEDGYGYDPGDEIGIAHVANMINTRLSGLRRSTTLRMQHYSFDMCTNYRSATKTLNMKYL